MVEGTLGWTSRLMGQQLPTHTPFLPWLPCSTPGHCQGLLSIPPAPTVQLFPVPGSSNCAKLTQLPPVSGSPSSPPCIRFTQLPPVPGAPLERSQTF